MKKLFITCFLLLALAVNFGCSSESDRTQTPNSITMSKDGFNPVEYRQDLSTTDPSYTLLHRYIDYAVDKYGTRDANGKATFIYDDSDVSTYYTTTINNTQERAKVICHPHSGLPDIYEVVVQNDHGDYYQVTVAMINPTGFYATPTVIQMTYHGPNNPCK